MAVASAVGAEGLAMKAVAGRAPSAAPLCTGSVAVSEGTVSTIASSGVGSYGENETVDISELFDFGSVLGKGSFGVVRQATRRRASEQEVQASDKEEDEDEEVAVKVLHRREPAVMLQLGREASTLRSLSHPNVVRAFESMDCCSQSYLAIELCRGGCLVDMIAKNRGSRCSDPEARHLFAQVADVVCYLHSVNLVHRDLKLENFVIKDADLPLAQSTIKLVDFGFATTCAQGSASLKTMCGSFSYMAPEVFFRGSYNEKCDIWSCGVILFCMLSGRMPFDGKSLQQVMGNVKSKTPGQLVGGVTLGARQLVGRLLCKAPESRWSAKQVLAADWLRGTARTISRSTSQLARSATL